jgi:sec-independent protein translocase protein TatA
MPFNISPTELIVILVILLLVFGPGRIGKLGREMGKSISEFRKGLNEKGENVPDEQKEGQHENISTISKTNP